MSCSRSRTAPVGAMSGTATGIADAAPRDAAPLLDAAPADAASSPPPTSWSPPSSAAIDGPRETPLEPGRPIFYAFPRVATDVDGPPFRLIGHLHGMCGPPVYACGKWIGAGASLGAMVCPTGNTKCGDSPVGPPSWEAPTWPELVTLMDHDLEAAIARVLAKRPGSIRKEGAVLTGYSRGAYAAPVIARKRPGRWSYLVLIEANVPLSAAALRSSGVRAVALVAGEQGTEIAGERKTVEELEAAGFPARLFVMKKTGHLYSEDMEYVMHDALAFVLAH